MKHGNADELKYWKDQIAVMYLVREEMRKIDRLPIWKYFYPELAASEEQIATAQRHLGHSLDKHYRDFLMCANGWKSLVFTVNLFGTDDLMGSDLMNHALEMLEALDDAYPVSHMGFSVKELLPIAATFEERELHVISRPASHRPGVVICFSGEDVEEYFDFREYFLTMADVNRGAIDSLKKMGSTS